MPPERPATSAYAVARSVPAWAAAALPTFVVPVTNPGGNPVGCAFATTPRSPWRVVTGPVAVLPTEAPLNTAYVDAVPRFTVPVGDAASADGTASARAPDSTAPTTATLATQCV